MEKSAPEVSDCQKLKDAMLSCVKENGYVLEPLWQEQGEQFKNFQARPDDVWVMTLPRSGTKLATELVFLIMNDFDVDMAKKFPFRLKVPSINTSLCPYLWQRFEVLLPEEDNPKMYKAVPVDHTKSSAEVYANVPSPRLFKSHLPFSLIPSILESDAKVIYVARNAKDRLVSWWKFLPILAGFSCNVDFATFWKYVKEEKILYEPTWRHIREGWAQRNNPNVLFLFYEDMRKNLPDCIRRIADFLNKPITDEQVKVVADFVDIDRFRNYSQGENGKSLLLAPELNVNKGQVGGYRDIISPEIEAEMDEWISEGLRDMDLEFPKID